jgi:mannose-6-phosphate isomerase-like protein (cupin superfamily)
VATTESPSAAVFDLAAALNLGAPPPGNLAVPVFMRGELAVEFYAPKDEDRQHPHSRDEVYVVVSGIATFFDGEARRRVEPGAFIFVEAGRVHRFEQFSADFAVWVIFYGPEYRRS